MASRAPIYDHVPKNVLLILLSLLLLPLDTCILFIALSSSYTWRLIQLRNHEEHFRPTEQKTILVTGVGMTKGLVLARSFSDQGHRVIGADFSPFACGRLSKSLSKYQVLPAPNDKEGSSPYIQALLDIIQRERIDVWVSCSGVASAIEDGEAKEIIEARTSCKAIQFDVATTERLHEKHKFIQYCQEIGLVVPETLSTTSSTALKKALENVRSGRKYILKSIGVDDQNRGDLTLLPKATQKETEEHISKLDISETSPWILQQFIQGNEYCTHSLVVNGRVKAFVACPSAELLMHYEALPSSSRLSQAMLDFTKRLAERSGPNFTGHLSFDFMVEESLQDKGSGHEFELYTIECNPRAHTANILLRGTSKMSEAYLSLLETSANDSSGPIMPNDNSIITPEHRDRYFWTGHDFIELVLLPVCNLLTLQPEASLARLIEGLHTFVSHILFWRDGTFEWCDPAPWWMLYHVYWPMQFWRSLQAGKKWSRINVSTTKMFAC